MSKGPLVYFQFEGGDVRADSAGQDVDFSSSAREDDVVAGKEGDGIKDGWNWDVNNSTGTETSVVWVKRKSNHLTSIARGGSWSLDLLPNGTPGLSVWNDEFPEVTSFPFGGLETVKQTVGEFQLGLNEWTPVQISADQAAGVVTAVFPTGPLRVTDIPDVPAQQIVTGGANHGYGTVLDFDEFAYYDRVLSADDFADIAAAGGVTVDPWGPGSELPVTDPGSLGPNCSIRGDQLMKDCIGDPIDTRNGNLHMPVPELSVSGRGPGLSIETAYNSLAASFDSKAGFGWSTTLDMRLVGDTGGDDLTVHQGGGSQVPFEKGSGGTWSAGPKYSAELVENVDGSFTFTRNHFENFRFSGSDGRLLSMSDQYGNTTTVGYGANLLKPSYLEDEDGRRFTFTWADLRLDTVTDPLEPSEGGPRVADFDYDSSGNLTAYKDFSGGTTVFTYDGQHRLLTMRKPRHSDPAKVIENHYDSVGRVEWQEDELNRRTTLQYDTPSAGSTLMTLPDSTTTAGATRRLDKYVDGVLAEQTVGYGTSAATTTKFAFDTGTNARTSITDGADNVTRFGHDGVGNLTSIEDPTGRISRYTYDGFDQVLTSSSGEVRTGPSSTSVADVVTTVNTYESTNGRLESTTTASGSADEALTDFVYGDPAHPEDVTKVVDPRGKEWLSTYDPGTGLRLSSTDPLLNTSTVEYNSIGWPVVSTSPRGVATSGTAHDFETTYSYDIGARSTTVTGPAGDVSVTVLDANGNTSAVKTGEVVSGSPKDVTSYSYSDADELAVVDPPGAGSKSYTYWPGGQRMTFTNELGAVTSYFYDPAGRLVSETDPNSKVTGYAYDAAGRLATVTQPGAGATCTGTKVACVTYAYDDAGRPTGVDYTDPATPDVSGIGYDALGRRTAATAAGVTETWAWDAQSRLTGHSDANGRTSGYAYDDGGNNTSITYPDGVGEVVRGFDDAGRLKTVKDWDDRMVTFAYDADSNWTTSTFPYTSGSGTANTDQFSYDAAGRMASVTWRSGGPSGTVLGSETYTRPNATKGMVETNTPTGTAGSTVKTNGYDTRDRLTAAGPETFSYDPEAPQVLCRIFLSWKDVHRAEEDRSEGQGALRAAGA